MIRASGKICRTAFSRWSCCESSKYIVSCGTSSFRLYSSVILNQYLRWYGVEVRGGAGCCGVLRGVAGCCGVLRGVVGCCGVLRGAAGCCGVLRGAAWCCVVLRSAA